MAEYPHVNIPQTPPTHELGTTGLRRGRGRSGVDSDFLPQFSSLSSRTKLYHEMASNNPTVGASLHAIKSLITRAPLIIEASGDKPRHKKAAEFVQRVLTPAMVRELLDMAVSAMMVYGFAVSEIKMAKDKETGWYAPVKFAPRAPRSILDWVWNDTDDSPVAFIQQDWANGHELTVPMSRCMHFRVSRGDDDNPEGVSLLRPAYSSHFFMKRLQEVEAIGLERDLSGLPLIRLPGEMLDPGATADQKAALATFQTLLKDIRRDSSEGIIIPSDMDENSNPYFSVELLSVSGNRQVNVSGVIERYAKSIAQTTLTEFLYLGVSGGATGSFALADSKTSLFTLSLRAILDAVADQLRGRVLGMVAAANGLDPELMPDVRFGAVEPPDVDLLAQFVERLTRSGFDLSDPATEESLREAASLPAAPSAEEKVKNAEDRKALAEAAGVAPAAPAQNSARGTGESSALNETARTANARQNDDAAGAAPTPARAKSLDGLDFGKGLHSV